MTVDLSSSLLDTTSLGLAASGITGADMSPGSTALSDAITAAANMKFDVYVGGATAAVTVDFGTNFTNVSSQADLVNHLNNAFAAAASSSTTLAAANIRASIDTDGMLTFTSSRSVRDQGQHGRRLRRRPVGRHQPA